MIGAACVLLAALAASATGATAGPKYDYIVVGGGLSGLVVANRLTEDPSVSVLVLEAGQSTLNNPNVSTPGLRSTLTGSRVDWNLTTTPQRFLAGRTLPYEQGLGLGGGSAVNFEAYARGAPSVLDAWAAAAGDASWAWPAMQRHYNRAVRFAPPPRALGVARNASAYARAAGPVRVSYPAWQETLGPYFLAAWTNASDGGPGLPVVDFNAGAGIGAGYHTMTIDPRTATRSSAAVAYWAPAAGRKNYHTQTGAFVTRVVLAGGAAVGVEYLVGNATHTARARKEVILAAGAIHTPKLLMLSGVGPAAHLAAHGVPLAVDLPGVGAHVQDHLVGRLVMEFAPSITSSTQWRNATLFAEIERNYTERRTGELSSDLGGAMAAEAVPRALLRAWNATYHLGLPADRNNVQYLFDAISYGPPQSKNLITFAPVLTTPESRGTIRLASRDPRAPALVDPNFLAAPADRRILVWAFRRFRAALGGAALARVRIGEVAPGANVTSDADILAAMKGAATAIHHICGSAGMRAREAGGVVDARLRVYGVRGLRVVDASVFPVIPTAQIQATVYALAEKAAEMIKSG